MKRENLSVYTHFEYKNHFNAVILFFASRACKSNDDDHVGLFFSSFFQAHFLCFNVL